MADAKRCDRCDTFYIAETDDEKGRSVYVRPSHSDTKRMDLCEDCFDELVDFLEKHSHRKEVYIDGKKIGVRNCETTPGVEIAGTVPVCEPEV